MPNTAVAFFISKFRELLRCEPSGFSVGARPRPYRNAAVRFSASRPDDFEARWETLQQTGLNAFLFPARQIPGCDLLSDSGTTTMTMEQWSQLLLGDEAYGSNEGFFALKEQVAATFGPAWQQTGQTENLFLFHQGRAAESALFSLLADLLRQRQPVPALTVDMLSADLECDLKALLQRKIRLLNATTEVRYIIPNNSHFDTTAANIEQNRMLPLDLPCREHVQNETDFPFRGNMNIAALRNLLENEQQRIPLIYLTVTNNAAGGQPVSLANIKAVRQLAEEFESPLFFDACRFAENAWFIQQREAGYREMQIAQIVSEMFARVDGFHISFKKDGLVNMGGALLLRQPGRMSAQYPLLADRLTDHQILTEGHPSYGGMAGRDLKGVVLGLQTVVRQDYLDHRIAQVKRFGDKLNAAGVPILTPVGGHAVYIDVDRFFAGTATTDSDFKGIALTALLLIAGHRFCELGVFAFGKYLNHQEFSPDPRINFVRGAVPRLAYEDQDLFSAAEALRILYEHRDRIPGVEVVHGRELSLRHFKSRFRLKDSL